MTLMGKKLTAAQALEGVFSSEGLVAMAGEDANVEIALARSLVERMDEGDARRMWNRTLNSQAPPLGRQADPEVGTGSPFWLEIEADHGKPPIHQPLVRRRKARITIAPEPLLF